MSNPLQKLHQRLGIASYWYLIIGGLLICAILFIQHLTTGQTPNNIAFTLPLIDTPIYWYGIFIIGGIALGTYVVTVLVEEKARALFDKTVPQRIRKQAIPLDADYKLKLAQRHVHTLGDLLFYWGLDPRYLNLKRAEIEEIGPQLEHIPGVDTDWLINAPWRIWNPVHVQDGIIWCLILGLIGARLYHVLAPSPSMAAIGIESPLDYFRDWKRLLDFQSGGLGIYGGLAGGALGLFLYTRRHHLASLAWADLAVIGVALGQVFGRWGNFFNQELYGRPTTLPWAITISPAHRLAGYEQFSQFHPAFLYESLWNLLAFVVLYTLATRYGRKLLTGELTALYLIFYAVGRILMETVRLDSRTLSLGGLELNMAVATFVSILVALASVALVAVQRQRRHGRRS